MGLIDTLKAEITIDPLVRGYAGMTDQQVADSLNTVNRTRERPTLTAAVLYNAMDSAELNALDAAKQARVDRILSLGGDINLTDGAKARAELLAVFSGAGGTNTRPAIGAAVTEDISRATEIGLGHVWPGHVQTARL